MLALNSQLDDLIAQSEGRYLSSSELQGTKNYLHTVLERSKVYELLKDKSDALVRLALKKFMAKHSDIMKKHGKRCYYDMSCVIRYMALSILIDDKQFFKDSISLWDTNIVHAYQKQNSSLACYRCLEEVINENLPSNITKYIDPYMQMMLEALDLPPKPMSIA